MTCRAFASAVIAFVLLSPAPARADVVLDWNAIAVDTAIANGQNPFSQARFGAIVQLAVFEAVNAIKRDYKPYLGTVAAPRRASAEAAAIAAAHRVLWTYFAASRPALDAARASALALIPDGQRKEDGIATGEAAAEALIANRVNDGSSPAQFYPPAPQAPGVWEATPSCPLVPPVTGTQQGVLLQWREVKPFGIMRAMDYLPGPPPDMTSRRYRKDYDEVMRVGDVNSTERPQDRANVAQFYAASSPTYLLNLAARQVAYAQRRSLSHNARALALINMAINDSLIASFATKYHYDFWRPETAIRKGDTDGNPRTVPDINFMPYIVTPCFPSYPSNHAAGSTGGAEMLARLYGEGRHDITLANPAVPGITLQYTRFKQITADVDDARVYGGIHFRFDQEVGGRLGREIATDIYYRKLRRAHHGDDDHDGWK